MSDLSVVRSIDVASSLGASNLRDSGSMLRVGSGGHILSTLSATTHWWWFNIRKYLRFTMRFIVQINRFLVDTNGWQARIIYNNNTIWLYENRNINKEQSNKTNNRNKWVHNDPNKSPTNIGWRYHRYTVYTISCSNKRQALQWALVSPGWLPNFWLCGHFSINEVGWKRGSILWWLNCP